MVQAIKKSFIFLVIFTIICGAAYPVFITVIAQLFFKDTANGALLELNGEVVGSKYVGQNFISDEYFWGRGSYEASSDIPEDLSTPSASGIDQNITVEAAYYQAERIAKTRNVPISLIYSVIEENIESMLLHETRFVNVLELNIKLEEVCQKS